jgi:hypothetical protein
MWIYWDICKGIAIQKYLKNKNTLRSAYGVAKRSSHPPTETEDPGFESRQDVWFLGLYTFQWCCQNLICIVIVLANAFISPFNTQTMHIKSFYAQRHSYVFPKNLIPWRDSNPSLLVPEADAMSSAPRRQMHCLCVYLRKMKCFKFFKIPWSSIHCTSAASQRRRSWTRCTSCPPDMASTSSTDFRTPAEPAKPARKSSPALAPRRSKCASISSWATIFFILRIYFSQTHTIILHCQPGLPDGIFIFTQCIISFDNSTAMYVYVMYSPKNLTPWRDLTRWPLCNAARAMHPFLRST